ncbi:MAG: sulfurtransferase TusA family protein [Thermohalobaculum sp.]
MIHLGTHPETRNDTRIRSLPGPGTGREANRAHLPPQGLALLRARRYGFAMSTTDPIDAELDATGLLCPLPVLKARKRLSALGTGAVLRIRADDPVARIDFPNFCTEQGHALIAQTDEPDGVMIFLIRKGG